MVWPIIAGMPLRVMLGRGWGIVNGDAGGLAIETRRAKTQCYGGPVVNPGPYEGTFADRSDGHRQECLWYWGLRFCFLVVGARCGLVILGKLRMSWTRFTFCSRDFAVWMKFRIVGEVSS